MLGTILLERNEQWLNAGPTAWLVFSADNGDIKFPHRVPITVESHENMLLFDCNRQPNWKAWKTCCSSISPLQLTYDMQASQSVAAGYFGGYSAKMQDVGHKELQRMEEAVHRRTLSDGYESTEKSFHMSNWPLFDCTNSALEQFQSTHNH